MTLTKTHNNSSDFDAFQLAIAVIVKRIADLPKEDRDDLYDLTKALFSADSDDERQAAKTAMQEILEQRPLNVVRFENESNLEPLSNWLAFISEKIKALRKEAGLTQAELAEKAGLTQSHISRLEMREHSPSNKTLQKIADALRIPLSKLDPSA